MSLRIKALLVFSLTLILLFGIIVALSTVIIEKQFTTIERDRVLRESERFVLDLQNALSPVAATVGDWAPWDELYAFAENKKPTFVRENINDSVLTNLGLDFFVFLRQDGAPFLVAGVSSRLEEYGITSSLLVSALNESQVGPQWDIDQPLSGFIKIDHQLALVSALPIVPSSRRGTPVGTLVGGKICGEKMIESFEKYNDYRVRLEMRSLPSTEGVNPEVVTRLLHGMEISTVVPIRGINGKLIATAELTSTNSLRTQATKTIHIFLIGLASSAGILLFVVWYLLDSSVIHPVQRLADKLIRAAKKRELPSHLGISGRDELANLAHCIEDLARAVAHAEASYRAIVEDQTDFIFRYRPDGHLTFVNEAMCRYFSKSREEMLCMNVKDFVATEDLRRVATALGRLSLDEPVATLDHRVPSMKSGVIWFRRTDRGIFSENGSLREIQCVACDITQAHLAREWLRASEVRYRRLFETATDGILIVRKSTHVIMDVNPVLCQMLNCKHSVLVERPIEYVPPFKPLKIQAVLADLLDDKSVLRKGEIALPLEKGYRYLEVTTSAYDMEGEPIVQFNFRDITERKRASDELRELSGHLLRSQDEERRRIARELHDSTAQNLSALQMAVAKLDSFSEKTAKADAIRKEIQKLADMSSREIRTISYLLHPPLLDEVGLVFALRWYVDGYITRTERIVHLDVPDTLGRLPSEIETTIFRVVQEGLTNIHRHSGSRRAWIRLTVEKERMHLEIRDDGKGLPADASDQNSVENAVIGVGIAGMRERLRQFNGSLEIKSDGQGTVLHAILPLTLDEITDG